MKRSWWKILSVIIILYSFIAGLLVPLKPGIVSAGPQQWKSGQQAVVQTVGYNTFYTQSEGQIRAWLKFSDTLALAAEKIEVRNDRELNLQFALPAALPIPEKVAYFTLLIDNPVDGAHILPDAISVTGADSIPGDASAWLGNPIEKLHKKAGITYPYRNILAETIRNAYYHIPMWFAMILLFLGAVWSSIQYLRTRDQRYDLQALALTQVGILYGFLGLITGAIWARNTWGAYWSGDIKQNMTAIALLIYLAYLVLRNAFSDPDQRSRLAAVYNVFSFVAMIPLIFVIPRMYDSLHPGNGGNPALGGEDLDNTMRLVFYPAIIGWTLFGIWLAAVSFRISRLGEKVWENNPN